MRLSTDQMGSDISNEGGEGREGRSISPKTIRAQFLHVSFCLMVLKLFFVIFVSFFAAIGNGSHNHAYSYKRSSSQHSTWISHP